MEDKEVTGSTARPGPCAGPEETGRKWQAVLHGWGLGCEDRGGGREGGGKQAGGPLGSEHRGWASQACSWGVFVLGPWGAMEGWE